MLMLNIRTRQSSRVIRNILVAIPCMRRQRATERATLQPPIPLEERAYLEVPKSVSLQSWNDLAIPRRDILNKCEAYGGLVTVVPPERPLSDYRAVKSSGSITQKFMVGVTQKVECSYCFLKRGAGENPSTLWVI